LEEKEIVNKEVKEGKKLGIVNKEEKYFNIKIKNYFDQRTRKEILEKYKIKRKNRTFKKIIRYEKRKVLAENRPRYKGRFVTQEKYNSIYGNK
jgi:hypothetical protein